MATQEHLCLNTIIASELMQQCMEQLAGTEAYRQEIKMHGNRLQAELLRYTAKMVPLV